MTPKVKQNTKKTGKANRKTVGNPAVNTATRKPSEETAKKGVSDSKNVGALAKKNAVKTTASNKGKPSKKQSTVSPVSKKATAAPQKTAPRKPESKKTPVSSKSVSAPKSTAKAGPVVKSSGNSANTDVKATAAGIGAKTTGNKNASGSAKKDKKLNINSNSLPPKILREFKSMLLKERAEYSSQVESLSTSLHKQDEDNFTEDGSNEFERTTNLNKAGSYQGLIDKIDAALKSIEDGTFGHCEECGELINIERLRAMPHVATCIKCQNGRDGGKASGRNRIMDLWR